MNGGQIDVQLLPRAGHDALVGWQGNRLRVRVAAPPVEGRANEALVQLVAKAVGLPPSRVSIISGHRARSKRLAIAGFDQAEIERRLGKP